MCLIIMVDTIVKMVNLFHEEKLTITISHCNLKSVSKTSCVLCKQYICTMPQMKIVIKVLGIPD